MPDMSVTCETSQLEISRVKTLFANMPDMSVTCETFQLEISW